MTPTARETCRTRVHIARRSIALLLCVSLLAGGAVRAQGSTPLAPELADARSQLSQSARSHGAEAALAQLYAPGNALLWSRDGAPTAQAQALLAELGDAATYGLRSTDYSAAPLAALLHGLPAAVPQRAARLTHFDVQLSAAALHFISDLHFGRVAPEAAGFKLDTPREPVDLVQAVHSLAEAADTPGALKAVEPGFYHYTLLKDALAHYRTLAPQAQPSALPAIEKAIKPGDPYPGAAALRHLLLLLGDLPADAASSDTRFDATLSQGVRRFQERHGLSPDGVLGKGTLVALKTPLAQRIRQIALTLERWRWLAPFKTPPIIVNIPQFQLFAFRTTEDRVAEMLQMRVIVGRTFASAQTPVFEGDMRYVVLRPYWDVPYSITKREMLPKILANPAYLSRQRLELVNGQGDSSPVVAPTPENIELLASGKLRLRQQPGEDNALGLVKFMFPNSYNVYLHSTPAHQLFQQSVRAFSHGCIRVADPLALASLVLKNANGEWTQERIQAAMDGTGANGPGMQRVNLERPINVLILYATALAVEDGSMLFFEDIYGYDRRLERQLGLAPVH